MGKGLPAVSAGLLMFRRSRGGAEVFLVHPGGPFWKNKDAGVWSIPKGLIDPGEEPLAAARREFQEETGIEARGNFQPIGTIQQKAGKIVHAWAFEGDADAESIRSNMTRVEMPRGSGRWIEVPEVDRAGWFEPEVARQKINPAQAEFIDRLLAAIA
ncbi:MAG TPA: NUDIX domain-containing protein [Pirellulaceae bacterium]|jgi:predicted NUDIX family NTP pyrophosphohydrolase